MNNFNDEDKINQEDDWGLKKIVKQLVEEETKFARFKKILSLSAITSLALFILSGYARLNGADVISIIATVPATLSGFFSGMVLNDYVQSKRNLKRIKGNLERASLLAQEDKKEKQTEVQKEQVAQKTMTIQKESASKIVHKSIKVSNEKDKSDFEM